jgi:hypothetical protein
MTLDEDAYVHSLSLKLAYPHITSSIPGVLQPYVITNPSPDLLLNSQAICETVRDED